MLHSLMFIGHTSLTEIFKMVRIIVVPVQLTPLVNEFVVFKQNALFNSFLLYRPYICSEIHALSHFSNEKYWHKLQMIYISYL